MGEAQSLDFDDLVRAHAGLVSRIASTYERRPAIAEELVQEIFLAVYRALPGFRGEASIRTFIARIASNVGVDHVRRASRRPKEAVIDAADHIADRKSDHEEQTDLTLKRERLLAAIRSLDLSPRQIISLHLEGFSNAEIADALSLTANNVGVRLHRAKTELQRQLLSETREEVQ